MGKTLEVVNEELWEDESLRGRTGWKPEDIFKLLEISVETYFKTLDGQIYFQRDGLPIGKSISKLMAGIYMHWLRRTMCLMKTASSRAILFSGRDKWMMYSSCGGGQKMIWICLCGF